jgi:hypothetical protein
MKKELSENIKQRLKELVRNAEQEDQAVRERQIRQWRQLKLFWEGFQKVYYSEVAHDWRIYDETANEPTDQGSYDKPINVFRAYLESLIAALSVTVPSVKCYPDDADNTLDLATARAGDKIAQLIYRHNDVTLLWLHALFIFMTEGLVACYAYPKEDKEYGTYEEKEYKDDIENHEYSRCPECQELLDDKLITPEQLEAKEKELEDEFMPDEEPRIEKEEYCPACAKLVLPENSRESLTITRLIGITNKPKSRICTEVYGGLYVKVPNYAKRQEQCPYLIYSFETNYAFVLEQFPHLKDKLKTTGANGAYDQYDQWGRLNPQYRGEYPINVVTMKYAWLRPALFHTLKDEDETEELKRLFPNGAKVILANDDFAEAYNENLDDCWTLSHNPLSDYLHHDPLGLLLVSVQEITNDLISLVIQTIEHGISLLFADPGSLNFKAFENTEVTPGGVFPASTKTGKSLQESFYDVKPAHLSPEVLPFFQTIQSLGQMVSGALPSLFGGSIKGSDTASEYAMSRAQALQRLQTTWKIFTIWWKNVQGKVIPMYIKEVKEDERDVQQDDSGNFINVFIRKAELEGKIGKIELETSENLPITWAQQKDAYMQLLMTSNPEILKIIASPENLPILRQAIGLVDLYVPGEDDREKQYDEIKLLLNSEPIMEPPEQGEVQEALLLGIPLPQELELPSIEPEEIDNHIVHYETCRKWAVSEAGRQTKTDNPLGYKNVLLHAKMHQIMMTQTISPQEEIGVVPAEKPNANRNTPITGEENVQTV